MNTMCYISITLDRVLCPSEQNMFKFPRACYVCHESNSKALKNCHFCGSVSFCQDHASLLGHKSFCPEFVACFSFDLLRPYITRMSIAYALSALLGSKAMDFIHYSKEIVKPPSTMRQFLDTYFKKIVDVRREESRPEYWDMFISEYFTRPLTLISAMEIMGFEPKSDFVIHILGSNHLELDFCAWEIILHWFPEVQRLKVILIGPDLWGDPRIPDLCDCCTSNEKSLDVEIQKDLYHDYVEKGYSKPSLIIGYNIGISEFEEPGSNNDTWKPTVLTLPKDEVPFILTAYIEEEAHKDHKRMCLFLGSSTKYFWFGKNQFASLRPVRDFETESFFYQNNYLVIYNVLPKQSANSVSNAVEKNNFEEKKINCVEAETKINSTPNNENISEVSSEEKKETTVQDRKTSNSEGKKTERNSTESELENSREGKEKKEIRELREEITNLQV